MVLYAIRIWATFYRQLTILVNTNALGLLHITRDIVEISHVTYRKLYELKVVTQPVKIIRTKDLFKPKKGNGVVTKKGEQVCGKIEGV